MSDLHLNELLERRLSKWIFRPVKLSQTFPEVEYSSIFGCCLVG